MIIVRAVLLIIWNYVYYGSFLYISNLVGIVILLVLKLLEDFECRTLLGLQVLDQGGVIVWEGLEVGFDLVIALVLFLILSANKVGNKSEGLILSTLEGFVHDWEDFLVLTVLGDSIYVGLELLDTSLFDHALVLQLFSLIFDSVNLIPVNVRILELVVFILQLLVILFCLLEFIFLLFQCLLLQVVLLLKGLELFHFPLHFLLESGVLVNSSVLVFDVLVFSHFLLNYCKIYYNLNSIGHGLN